MKQSRRHSGMTIHRSRTDGKNPARQESFSVSDAGALLTIVQVVVCVLLLVTVFTLQFLDKDSYHQAGELYRAAMQGEAGEAMFVGAFGTPLTRERLEDYYAHVVGGALPRKLFSPEATLSRQEQPQVGQGGEVPYRPPNLYPGRVLLSAQPTYPTYGIVTSGYGVRVHPITGKADFHTGLDIAAPLGSDVYAALPGTVSEVGFSKIYGNYLRLSHGPGVETVYNHCSALLAPAGAVVRRGERIALVGSTGVSTGPHLHFDLLVKGCYADPMQVLR